jgi:hypothetical protein
MYLPLPDPFNPDLLRLPDEDIPCVRVETSARKRRKSRFYQIDEQAFRRACHLPGKSLAVYLLLLRRSAQKRDKTVLLPTVLLREYGITRWQKEVALGHLARAGLVTIVARAGKSPRVTLLAPN